MGSEPAIRPSQRKTCRTHLHLRKGNAGRCPGLPDGKQTRPFRPSQRNSGTPSAFPKGSGPASGLFNGTQAHNRPSQRKRVAPRPSHREASPQERGPASGIFNGTQAHNRPSQREPGRATAFSTERKPFPTEFESALGLPNLEASPHPAFSTKRKPSTALLKGNRPRHGLFNGTQTFPNGIRIRPWPSQPGSGPASGLFNETQAHNRPSQREPGRAKAFSTERKPFPTEFKPALGLRKGKRARNRPFQRNTSPQPPFLKETSRAKAFA